MNIRAAAIIMLVSSLAFAQEKPKALGEELSGAALQSFEQAKDLFEHGAFPTAHAKYKQAYELSRNARLLWNMAACSARLQHFGQAIGEAERYLSEGRGKLTGEQVDKATGSLGDWRAFTAEATLTVTPLDANIRIDDDPRGVVNGPMKAYLDVGKHEIALEKTGFEALTQTLVIREVGKQTFAFTLKALATAPARLVVNTDIDARVELDGREMGIGLYDGNVAAGTHKLRIVAPSKVPYENTIEVAAGATKQMTVTLSREGNPALASVPSAPVANENSDAWWPWAVGGALLAGAGVGAYYLFKPSSAPGAAPAGTISNVEVP